mmetsp:Transcript_11630/g.15762  ORF Transcript_11630/g.15762 Transcript_11630/m.15762 type:complete len:147 (+) Transcript_11630:328-768(+)
MQFIFQWLSLLIFTLEYLSTEQEVRKVLDLPSSKRKLEIYFISSLTLLFSSVLATYLICQWLSEPFFNSWVSSLGEAVVAGALFGLQGAFIKQISTLIKESNLDLVPVRLTFCANLSCVGFIFLVQCGDLAMHFIVSLVGQNKSEE